MITIHNLSKYYGGRSSEPVCALEHFSLNIAPGEFLALLGPNGSGKSTLFRCTLGITDYEGSISIDGLDPLREGKSVRSRIGYMPQQVGLQPDLTVEESVQFYVRLRQSSIEWAEYLLESVKLTEKLGALVSELSGGMRQRLSYVVASLSDPSIYLLDEPTTSLDHTSQEILLAMLARLKAQGKTILIATHAASEFLPLSDRVIELRAPGDNLAFTPTMPSPAHYARP